MSLPYIVNVSFELKVIFPPSTIVPGAVDNPSLIAEPTVVISMFLPSNAVRTNLLFWSKLALTPVVL